MSLLRITGPGRFERFYRRQMVQSRKTCSRFRKTCIPRLSHFIAQQAVAAFDKRGAKNASLQTAADLLRKWDGQMDKDQPAPLIAALMYQQLRRAVGDRASNGKGDLWETVMAGPVIERILRDRPAEWFRDYDQLAAAVFRRCDGRRQAQPGPRSEPVAIRRLPGNHAAPSGPRAGELGETRSDAGQILPHQHRACSDERFVDDR